mgnify:FL=1
MAPIVLMSNVSRFSSDCPIGLPVPPSVLLQPEGLLPHDGHQAEHHMLQLTLHQGTGGLPGGTGGHRAGGWWAGD